MGRELELKLRAPDAQTLLRVRQGLPHAAWERWQMETTYFDTPARQLQARKWTLRRRMENDKSIICLKTSLRDSGALQDRGEWQVDGEQVLPAVDGLLRCGAPAELAALCAGGIVSTCEARFVRYAALLRLADGSCCELALDEGVLRGGGREQPFCELELELKEGAPDAMLALGVQLAQTYALCQEEKSKFVRAAALAESI